MDETLADWATKFTVVCLDGNALKTQHLRIDRRVVDICSRGKRVLFFVFFIMMRGYLWAWWGTHVLGNPPDTHTHTHTPCLQCIVHLTNCPADCAHYQLNQQIQHAEIKKWSCAFISHLQPVVRHLHETYSASKQYNVCVCAQHNCKTRNKWVCNLAGLYQCFERIKGAVCSLLGGQF